MIIKRISLLTALLLLCLWPSPVTRQVIAARTPDPVYLFIEVETKVYRKGVEISSENPEERRRRATGRRSDVLAYQTEGDAVFQPQRDGSI
jgi:hypothetical protein